MAEWRASDESLLQRLEDEALAAALMADATQGRAGPEASPARRGGLVALLARTHAGRAARERALAGDRGALEALVH
ncbi:MAG: hypothetical protein AAGH15_26105, partial [Myxococcota bacterium]